MDVHKALVTPIEEPKTGVYVAIIYESGVSDLDTPDYFDPEKAHYCCLGIQTDRWLPEEFIHVAVFSLADYPNAGWVMKRKYDHNRGMSRWDEVVEVPTRAKDLALFAEIGHECGSIITFEVKEYDVDSY